MYKSATKHDCFCVDKVFPLMNTAFRVNINHADAGHINVKQHERSVMLICLYLVVLLML